jgi:hypothetical protein
VTTPRDWTEGVKPEVLATFTPRRHDADGHVYLAYYRNDRVLGFIWDGNIEHPIQVTHEMGEAVHDTFELDLHGAITINPSGLFLMFKRACDQYADTERNDA